MPNDLISGPNNVTNPVQFPNLRGPASREPASTDTQQLLPGITPRQSSSGNAQKRKLFDAAAELKKRKADEANKAEGGQAAGGLGPAFGELFSTLGTAIISMNKRISDLLAMATEMADATAARAMKQAQKWLGM